MLIYLWNIFAKTKDAQFNILSVPLCVENSSTRLTSGTETSSFEPGLERPSYMDVFN